MKKNPFYSLQTLSDGQYLLPFGQAVASRAPGVRLQGGAAALWACLDEAPDRASLLRTFCADAPDAAAAASELSQTLEELQSLGILLPEDPVSEAAARCGVFSDLCIGPLRVRLLGDAARFSADFAPYLAPADPGAALCQTVAVTEAEPPVPAGMLCLLQTGELAVFRDEDGGLLLQFPSFRTVAALRLRADGALAVCHVRGGQCAAELFHAIRHAFLFRAQRCGFFALHAASILYRDRVWLISAPAGTGKSTHARLWAEQYGAPVLNGDLALLSAGRGGAVFHPMPWCGTSGVARNETHPLGGVIFLRRAADSRAELLPPAARQLRCANRLISPVWTEEMLQENLAFAGLLAGRVPMWSLRCTAAPDAAAVMKAAVDAALEEAVGHG